MRRFLFIALLFAFFSSYSQVIKNLGSVSFVQNFTDKDYNAARQNWQVVQDKQGLLYFANTSGSVLQFDGINWTAIKVSDLPVTSLYFDSTTNYIYVGGKNIIGFLKPTLTGMKYVSLKNLLPDNYTFYKIWEIKKTKDSALYFMTNDEIFLYKNDTIKILKVDDFFPQSLFLISFYVDDEIWINVKYKGLARLVGDSISFIPSSSVLANSMVRGVVPYKNGEKLVVTWFDGFWIYKNGKFTHVETPVDSIVMLNPYKVFTIKDKYYAIPLYEKGGLLIIDKNFNVIQYLSKRQQLKNDRIYNVFEDNSDNLWLCTDNGLANVYLFSPFTMFSSYYGIDKEAITLDAIIYDNQIFIATTSGVYFRKWTNKEDKFHPEKFKSINNLLGNLNAKYFDTINNELFVAASNGLYKIIFTEGKDDYTAQYIITNRSVGKFINPEGRNDVILALADVVVLVKKVAGQWKVIKNIEQAQGNYILEDNKGYIWLADFIRGITRIKFDSTYEKILDIKKYGTDTDSVSGLPTGQNIRIFKVANNILFTSKNGIYRFDYDNGKFYPDTVLSKYFGADEEIVMLSEDKEGNIWYKVEQSVNNEKSTWKLGFLHKEGYKFIKVEQPFYPFKNKIFSFRELQPQKYIIGQEGGFVHYDATIPFKVNSNFNALIRSVKINGIDSVIFGGIFLDKDGSFASEQPSNQIPELPYRFNNLRFSFSGTYYQFSDKIMFSYYLEGNDQGWSEWTSENYKDYSNLKPREYTFYVKAKNIYGQESTVAKYKFVIKPPFYLTFFAFVLYTIAAILLVWLIVWLYARRLRKQKEYLEEVVRQRTQEIEQQKHEIETQRDQLAQKNLEIEKINKDLTDSIEYAKRIQTAILPLDTTIRKHLEEYFILFKPRDIVSGDFYWFTYKDGKIFIAAVDCTGHGVPGAFMSMIGAEILTTIVLNENIYQADKILDKLNKYIRNALKQDTSDNQDGMDMALCVIDKEKKILEFAGAKNPLFYIHNNELTKIRGSRQAIGGYQFGEFVSHTIQYQTPTWFYIFSDGYADQFGGPDENEKFMVRRFKNLLLEIHQLPMEEQKRILDENIEKWKGNVKQTDDILVIGFKL